MGLEPISIKNMEEKTNDLYEAVVVMSKKAKQVINERTIEKLMRVAIRQKWAFLMMKKILILKIMKNLLSQQL